MTLTAGSKYLRIGYSGEDRPSVVVPSHVGVVPGGQLVFGDLALAHPRKDMEIKPVINATQILDNVLLEQLLSYGMQRLGAKWTEYPILFVDSPLWAKGIREVIAEILFDKFEVPALYFGRSAVLAAFSHGKHNALVIDLGASAVRVGPVHDGLLDKAGCVSQTFLGGDSITNQARLLLDSMNTPLHIHQQVDRKSTVGLGKPPNFEPKMLDVTSSFLGYHQLLLCDDFKESTVQISEFTVFDKSDLSMRPTKFYEFPDGFNQSFGLERYRLGEILFHPPIHRFDMLVEGESPLIGLSELIQRCLNQIDTEIRKDVQNNIILTGGGSSVHGLSERLSKELGSVHPLVLFMVNFPRISGL